ncbi:MAG: Hsp20/alpha crystallin family protein [Candidatus Gastranaerophilales bacterium]|nr:Hsp20/alpha crystallin family protein [Candidatus Gastranaerophilales bacterium]
MKYLIKKPDTFLNTLNEDINAILQKSFDNLFPEYIFHQELKGMAMPVDVKELENQYCVKVELPGISKENINIDINKSYVKIEANKEMEKEDEETNKQKYHKTEFRYGTYSRTLYFPYEINVEASTAELKKGILELHLPKLHSEDKETKKLEIKD